MERGKVLYSGKLSKKFFMQLSEGFYLVSNLYESRFESCFAEEVGSLRNREKQWKRIVSVRVSQRLCRVFRTQEDYQIWLANVNYFRGKGVGAEYTIH